MQQKSKRQRRKPRMGPYLKTNSYSKRASLEQVITMSLFLVQVGLHAGLVVPTLMTIRSEILWTLFGFQIFIALVVVYDYLWLTIKDPVDPLVRGEGELKGKNGFGLRYCPYCVCMVQEMSYHCMRCNRCTLSFDHHCKYLNNCIGAVNYERFLRLLSCVALFAILALTQAIWVFIHLQNAANPLRWGTLVSLIFDILLFLPIIVLELFHCYISCIENTTTFQSVFPQALAAHQQNNVQNVQILPTSQPLYLDREI